MSSYLPISGYGAIGNLHTLALIGRHGSIDWCCFPDLDRPSVFASLLDHEQGGRFQIRPVQSGESWQRYRSHTNVLDTFFDTDHGRLTVTDFMPLEGDLEDDESFTSPPEIHRVVRAEGGAVPVEVVWAPRFDYARARTNIHRTENGFLATGGGARLCLTGLPDSAQIVTDHTGRQVRAQFELYPGSPFVLVTRWDAASIPSNLDRSMRALAETLRCWRGWIRKDTATGNRSWAGHWNEQIIRCELALKLLSYAPTGAIAAAGTTSLPEEIGGVRNWDYRYSWIRDAALAAQALYALGHAAEGRAFINWAEKVSVQKGEEEWGLHILYDVHGNYCLPEEELSHLKGYRDSRPVRVGNGAADQLQLDIYGELIGAAYEMIRLEGTLDETIWTFLQQVANEAYEKWREPDFGIWEVRNGPLHFTYSKVRVWVALERAIRLVEEHRLEGDVENWQTAQQKIRETVLARGYDEELNSFVRTFDSKELDASNLLIPMMEFLPFEDPRIQGTIDRTLERLTVNDLVYRYHADDGIPGGEGAFGLCTFWLVDALALSGRLDEAQRIFENMANHANPVGLFSEQIDPHSGELLGNFPQAFTHIGMINSALYLAYMKDRETPIPAPIGSHEHRALTGNLAKNT